VRVFMPLSKFFFRSLFWVPTVMPFIGRTEVTEARRDEGTTESWSIATLMKYTFFFINNFYTESIYQFGVIGKINLQYYHGIMV
jgi:hypothetical protein